MSLRSKNLLGLLAFSALILFVTSGVYSQTFGPKSQNKPTNAILSSHDAISNARIPSEMNFLLSPEVLDEPALIQNSTQQNYRTNMAPPPIGVVWAGGDRWLSSVSSGGETFYGGFFKGINFFGSSITDGEYVPVELRFSSDPGDKSICQTFRRPGYNSVGVGEFPGSAWDLSDPENPRRLNICFVEWDDGGGPNPAPDFIWNPNGDGNVLGKREYIYIMNSDYDGDGSTYAGVNIDTDDPDVLYGWWPILETGAAFFQSDPASMFIKPYYDPITSANLYAIPASDQIELRWINTGGGSVTHLRLYGDTAYPPQVLLDSLDPSASSYTHTGLSLDDQYFYSIEALGTGSLVGCCDVAGDADNSGAVNIADATFLIARIFSAGPAPACEEEGDADNSGAINIGDVTYLVARIFAGGPAPVCDPPVTEYPVIGTSVDLVARAQVVSSGFALLGAWHGRGLYGDCWGYIDSLNSNHEYGLICARNEGVSIIDIEATPPVEVGFMPITSFGNDSKDVKVYKNYAFVIKEYEPTQVFDLTDVTNPVQVTTIEHAGAAGAHNCMIDGDFLYVVGNHSTGGLEIFDITNPASPVFQSLYQPFYYHDVDIRNDTMYACGIYGDGVDVLDISNKTSPANVTLFNYPGSGAHNAELLGSGDYVAIGDEIGSSGNHVRIFDISNIGSINKVFDIIVDPNAVVHNCYYLNDVLYIAHYTEGVRAWDVTIPTSPTEVGFYDTYNESGYGYNGCWNVYPYFPSGKIIASDMQTGLYVLETQEVE